MMEYKILDYHNGKLEDSVLQLGLIHHPRNTSPYIILSIRATESDLELHITRNQALVLVSDLGRLVSIIDDMEKQC